VAETLANLRTRVRRRADRENDPHITEPELTTHINASYKELWDLLVAASADYFLTSEEFTLSGSSSTRALPSGYYKTRGVDYSDSGEWRPLKRFTFHNRNRDDVRRYRVMGTNLRIIPEGNCPGTYRHWYEVGPTALSADGDTLNDAVDMWDEYIVVDAAIKVSLKSEKDVSALMAEKQALAQRISVMAATRDDGEPDTVTDVQYQDTEYDL